MRNGLCIALIFCFVLPIAGAGAESATPDRCVGIRMLVREPVAGWRTSRAEVPKETAAFAAADPDGAGRKSIFLYERASREILRADLQLPHLRVSPFATVPGEIDFASMAQNPQPAAAADRAVHAAQAR